MKHSATVPLLLTALLLVDAAGGADRLVVGRFSDGETTGWVNAGFDGIERSEYEIVTVDGRTALRGECDDSASAYVLEREVDLERYPVMRWSWRVDSVYEGIAEQQKSGDDFPARVYAIVDGGLFKWRTRAVNFVWASSLPRGEAWPNPFQDRAMMVAVQSGPGGGWVEEARNVREAFTAYFDREVDHIDGVAVMTDCDNHDGRGRAYFGDIYFTPGALALFPEKE